MRLFCPPKGLGVLFATLTCGLSFSQSPPGANLDATALLRYLGQTIGWYRHLDLQRQIVTDADEAAVVDYNQQIANQVMPLAFEFARVEAESIEKEAASAQTAGGAGSSRYLALRQMLAGLDQQVRANRQELESLRQKLAEVTGRDRTTLQARVAQVQSELELAKVRSDSLRSMTEFVGGSSANGLGATGIREKIEALARSVPAALAKPSTTGQEPAAAPANEQIGPAPGSALRKSEQVGIWALAADIMAISRRIRTVREGIELTDSQIQALRELRTPLVNTLRELSKRGDELAAQADTADEIVLVQQKAMLDALTAQFKRTSASMWPLTRQGIPLELYKKNLTNWQGVLEARYSAELKILLARLAVLAAVLAIAIAGSALWRRAILRYVRDPRRRHQFLLLRKIVFWCVIVVVLVFSFANELGSVATFAGLITAGLAVALQNVILSVVAYFFLIGRYGIRVGDRVQVAGITGEVVDIGLVRFYLLELVSGEGKTASGRVVAFSNSIVFQSSAGFFKQIPGTNFVWQEVTLTVPSDSDYRSAEERLLGVVASIFAEYRDEMEKQYRHMERTLATAPAGILQPTSRLHLTSSGVEVVIRYPVDLMRASEINDRVTRELLNVIDREPKLKPAGSGNPPLRLKTDISGSR